MIDDIYKATRIECLWYFKDEWNDVYGPYKDERECGQAIVSFFENVLGVYDNDGDL